MKKVNRKILTEAAAGRRPTSGRAPCLHIIRRLAGFQPAWAGLCPASGLSGRKRRRFCIGRLSLGSLPGCAPRSLTQGISYIAAGLNIRTIQTALYTTDNICPFGQLAHHGCRALLFRRFPAP